MHKNNQIMYCSQKYFSMLEIYNPSDSKVQIQTTFLNLKSKSATYLLFV